LVENVLDVKTQWLNVARRLQQCASCCGNSGVAIVTTHIIIDNDGLPVGMSEPKIVKLDPKKNKDALILLLTE
jgi:hypothetical protein